MLQLCVTVLFYLEIAGKYILEAWGDADPKLRREERGTPALWLQCNLLGSVSSQQKFEAVDIKALHTSQLWDSVIAPSVLFRK